MIIRDAACFGYQCAMNWTSNRTCTETTPLNRPDSPLKLTDLSRSSQDKDKWLLSAVAITVLFSITAMGFIAWFSFWGRDRHPCPHQTAAPSEDNKTGIDEIDEFPDVEWEERSDGWFGFVLACHAAITLGAAGGAG
ncbi:hypothetical protein N7535_009273 [Penicillium sp. DV-2018c]|nr:hypothetical protein N7461_002817 [Penicillium sp. DV-2018c]KAJ5561076.1 hypothetical protein N7535_009273 [Penicillium sp. DV-2018c]